MQNSLYLLCFLQGCDLGSANKLIFTALFAIRRAKKCKIAYIYCAFCNLESYKMQNMFLLHLGELTGAT